MSRRCGLRKWEDRSDWEGMYLYTAWNFQQLMVGRQLESSMEHVWSQYDHSSEVLNTEYKYNLKYLDIILDVCPFWISCFILNQLLIFSLKMQVKMRQMRAIVPNQLHQLQLPTPTQADWIYGGKMRQTNRTSRINLLLRPAVKGLAFSDGPRDRPPCPVNSNPTRFNWFHCLNSTSSSGRWRSWTSESSVCTPWRRRKIASDRTPSTSFSSYRKTGRLWATSSSSWLQSRMRYGTSPWPWRSNSQTHSRSVLPPLEGASIRSEIPIWKCLPPDTFSPFDLFQVTLGINDVIGSRGSNHSIIRSAQGYQA